MKEDVDLGRFFELATTDKIYVDQTNLLEIKTENLQGCKSDFDLNGSMIIGPIEYKTNIRIKNTDDFESYINAIDIDYDSEDVIFTGCVYKLNTPQSRLLNEVLTLKVVNICEKLFNFMDKTVI